VVHDLVDAGQDVFLMGQLSNPFITLRLLSPPNPLVSLDLFPLLGCKVSPTKPVFDLLDYNLAVLK
jgi:hypothetical protein